jgi:hypothetical protein
MGTAPAGTDKAEGQSRATRQLVFGFGLADKLADTPNETREKHFGFCLRAKRDVARVARTGRYLSFCS